MAWAGESSDSPARFALPETARGLIMKGRRARARKPVPFHHKDVFMSTAVSPSGNVNGSASTELRRVTVPDFLSARARGVRLTMLTAYDYTMARLLDAAGVDGLLVGDSLGMVVQGSDTSLAVTLDEVIYHTRLVARGVRRSLLVADLPFM